MSKSILVTYASRAGSTQGIAEAIGKTLEDQGFIVDVCSMEQVHSVKTYHAIVAGSAIRVDKWLPEAMQFIKTHQDDLLQKPFAAFVVCLAMAVQSKGKQAQTVKTATSYLKPIRELVPTVSEGLFAGVLDLSKLPLMYRIPFSVLTSLRLFKEGDYRNWQAIQQWSQNLPVEFMMATS